jgi:uncharacterized protein
MRGFFSILLSVLLLTNSVISEQIETFYGTLEVEEPVLLELIHSPAFVRLKSIHQYGVAYYTTHPEEYNRFDHSLGVFAILRCHGASLEEQIAGLLHDLSHTVFSHVGDWVFGKEYQEEDYQSTIHRLYLSVSGIEEILNNHGYTIDQIAPKNPHFVMLEEPLPNLSADRLDYNIQGAYFQGFLKKEEVFELFQNLNFTDGRWIIKNRELATKLMHFSLFMTENCWGSALNYVTSRWLAHAILQGLRTGLISWKEFHFGIDENVWEKLISAKDDLIQNCMHKVIYPNEYFHIAAPHEAALLVKFRCRGVDPWVLNNQEVVRLSAIDPKLARALKTLKERAAQGWPIVIYD